MASPELIRRLEAVVDSFSLARLDSLAEAGGAFDLSIARFGDSVAPSAVDAPELDFVNRITLSPDDTSRVGEILEHYRALGLRPWLEPPPGVELAIPGETELLGSQAVLFCRPGDVDGEAVGVREIDDADGTARLLLRAFGVPEPVIETNAPALAVAAARCGGRFFVVEADGAPVAAGLLTVHEGDGYLAMAGTLPEFRGRGFQRALVRARAAAAARADCDLVVATAAFPSTSHRNLERGGLRTAYTKPVLRLTPR